MERSRGLTRYTGIKRRVETWKFIGSPLKKYPLNIWTPLRCISCQCQEESYTRLTLCSQSRMPSLRRAKEWEGDPQETLCKVSWGRAEKRREDCLGTRVGGGRRLLKGHQHWGQEEGDGLWWKLKRRAKRSRLTFEVGSLWVRQWGHKGYVAMARVRQINSLIKVPFFSTSELITSSQDSCLVHSKSINQYGASHRGTMRAKSAQSLSFWVLPCIQRNTY